MRGGRTPMIRERELGTLPGLPMALLFFVVLCGLVYTLISGAAERLGRPDRRAEHRDPARRAALHGSLRRQSQRRPCAAAVRRLRRHGEDAGAALGQPPLHQAAHLAARAELRERPAEGERPRRQPDRDCRCRGVEGRRYGGSGLPRGRLPELREGADRGGRSEPCHELHLRRSSRRRHVAARQHRPKSPST